MTDPLPPGFDAYLAARAQQREERFNEQWDSLTAREQSLVREAAVMGFVRGSMYGQVHPRHLGEDEQFPRDSEILRDVVSGCEAYGDIYPVISHLGNDDAAHFEAWLTVNGVADISAITDDQRHAGYLNYLKRDPEDDD